MRVRVRTKTGWGFTTRWTIAELATWAWWVNQLFLEYMLAYANTRVDVPYVAGGLELSTVPSGES